MTVLSRSVTLISVLVVITPESIFGETLVKVIPSKEKSVNLLVVDT